MRKIAALLFIILLVVSSYLPNKKNTIDVAHASCDLSLNPRPPFASLNSVVSTDEKTYVVSSGNGTVFVIDNSTNEIKKTTYTDAK